MLLLIYQFAQIDHVDQIDSFVVLDRFYSNIIVDDIISLVHYVDFLKFVELDCFVLFLDVLVLFDVELVRI